jgi:hypothetical protein
MVLLLRAADMPKTFSTASTHSGHARLENVAAQLTIEPHFAGFDFVI